MTSLRQSSSFALVLCLALSGCDALGLGDEFSQADADRMAEHLVGTGANGAGGPGGPGLAALVVQAGQMTQASDGDVALPILINQQISARLNCDAGGSINLTGSITGTINDQGFGTLLLDARETITDWKCEAAGTINGDPYVSFAGHMSFQGGNMTSSSFSFGGGFKWRGGHCAVQLTFIMSAAGGGHASGTICGKGVDVTV